MRDVTDLALLVRRREGDAHRACGHASSYADTGDEAGQLTLVGVQADDVTADRDPALLAIGQGTRPTPDHHPDDNDGADHDDGDDEPDQCPEGTSHVDQLACRSALRVTPWLARTTPSTAPVTEFRRNRMLFAPDSSAALITCGLESMSLTVTLVPAVT